MRIPKCSKTVTGKHKWIRERLGMKVEKYNIITHDFVPIFGTLKITPYCEYCGLIDDRKLKSGLKS